MKHLAKEPAPPSEWELGGAKANGLMVIRPTLKTEGKKQLTASNLILRASFENS